MKAHLIALGLSVAAVGGTALATWCWVNDHPHWGAVVFAPVAVIVVRAWRRLGS